jgi:hypothetical protein
MSENKNKEVSSTTTFRLTRTSLHWLRHIAKVLGMPMKDTLDKILYPLYGQSKRISGDEECSTNMTAMETKEHYFVIFQFTKKIVEPKKEVTQNE